ncbi:kinase-like domain-containing protein [Corynascus novoguineensis]|uniref:Kinase-like domain-containing protein n=1 Tax=Corynascus novoguineensis TaxID=1126955 RepID=A0AAN7CR03_9PEZI|nr:kinase-like domain-containing protein [Corynascus novoguineensis]
MGWEVDSEHPYKYGPGGFCPIELGDRVANRFIVLHKLGYGGIVTVWLVRDEELRHGRYVALKVVSADWSNDAKFEKTRIVYPLRGNERDNGSPGLFVLELERVFHTSKNGRYLCHVFPVLGPTLASLNTSDFRLYPSFVRTFAQQLVRALNIMHALGLCHGDFPLNNIAIHLAHPLDPPTEEQLKQILGPPQIQTLEYFFPEVPSPASEYVVVLVDLERLPANYLSTRLCILDFDHAFSVKNAPKQFSPIPYQSLAPENIFTLTTGPPADIWALGYILYELRYPMTLFQDLMGSSPLATVSRMCEILGNPHQERMEYSFDDYYPVHEPLQADIEYMTLGSFTV